MYLACYSLRAQHCGMVHEKQPHACGYINVCLYTYNVTYIWYAYIHMNIQQKQHATRQACACSPSNFVLLVTHTFKEELYIYIYIYIYVYIYIYTHTHTHKPINPKRGFWYVVFIQRWWCFVQNVRSHCHLYSTVWYLQNMHICIKYACLCIWFMYVCMYFVGTCTCVCISCVCVHFELHEIRKRITCMHACYICRRFSSPHVASWRMYVYVHMLLCTCLGVKKLCTRTSAHVHMQTCIYMAVRGNCSHIFGIRTHGACIRCLNLYIGLRWYPNKKQEEFVTAMTSTCLCMYVCI